MTYTRIDRIPRVIHLHIPGADPFYPCIHDGHLDGATIDVRSCSLRSLYKSLIKERQLPPFTIDHFPPFAAPVDFKPCPCKCSMALFATTKTSSDNYVSILSKFCLYAMSLVRISIFCFKLTRS